MALHHVALAALVGPCLLLAGCGPKEVLSELGVPVGEESASVAQLVRRGRYLEARLQTGAHQRHLLLPANETCPKVLEPFGKVRFVEVGTLGEIARGALRCEVYGVASLAKWRDRRPRPIVTNVPLGDTARYLAMSYDTAVILVRGSFPKALRVGWRRIDDSVAMLANTPHCRAVAEAGQAAMAYYASGPWAFTLSLPDATCPIEGLARPY